jgi:hypothetical protein
MARKQQDPPLGSSAPVPAGDPDELLMSVAGEEDPGASLDLPVTNAERAVPPAGAGAQPPMAPGDQAPAGTPSTGENLCPACGGTGRLGAASCPNCQGTGIVIVGVSGA